MIKPVPNFTRLDPSRPDVAILMESHAAGSRGRRSPVVVNITRARDRHWWADVLADPRARIRQQLRGFYWLEATHGSIFFYPAAGSDYAEALTIFQGYVDTFWFCDITYPSVFAATSPEVPSPPWFFPDFVPVFRAQKRGATFVARES